MTNFLRPIVAFGIAGVVTVTGFYFGSLAQGGDGTNATLPSALLPTAAFGDRYELAELEYLQTTLYYLEESYVEPERIDYEKMYVSALEAVERKVPAAMFSRETGGDLLHIQVGDYRTVLRVEPVESSAALHDELAKVAEIISARLSASDIPLRDPNAEPEDPERAHFAEVEYTLINGMLSTLDPHSILLPPEDGKDMEVENQGHFGGLGISIVERDGQLIIDHPLKDTPAYEADLRSDDRIVRIDGESTINMSLDEAVTRLRGPVGAPVTIEIVREDLEEPLPVVIVRDVIKLNPVSSKLLDGGVGYIQISSFHAEVAEDLTTELARMEREARDEGGAMKGLILNLRGNPGGFLNQAVKVSETFLDEGVIVSTVNGAGRKLDEQTARNWGSEPDYPIVVITDARSASASEIVAGALRNNGRAVIVGERTFGKGSVQNLRTFKDDSKLKVTTSKYLTPGDRSIQSVGIPADIEMVATIAETRDVDDEQQPFVLVHWRERVHREGDLDKHLTHVSARVEEPAYSLRYLRSGDPPRRGSDEIDLTGDLEVELARDLILATPSARRADMLSAAAPVVERYRSKWQAEIESAMSDVGIDWQDGPSRSVAKLDAKLSLGEDGVLQAGKDERVTLEVTNNGPETLYRVVAVTSTKVEFLDGREFVIGKIQPGETRTYSHRVHLLDGYPTETTPVEVDFRDSGNPELYSTQVLAPVEGRDLPRFGWSWGVEAPEGERVEVGTTFDLVLTVENTGTGDAGEPFVRLKNKSGRALDILKGSGEPGFMRTADGADCAVTKPGVEAGTVIGDASADPERVAAGDPPVYDKDCSRSLLPGETWTGRFKLEAKELREGGLRLEVQLGDAAAYDHASIMRGGFYPYFTQRELIEFDYGIDTLASTRRMPPSIEVTRAPGSVVDGELVTLSGVVSDDKGLANVVIFHGDDKVFYQGSAKQDLKSVPFTTDVKLEPGLNTVAILATDGEGVTATRSVVTFLEGPEVQAKVEGVGEKEAATP